MEHQCYLMLVLFLTFLVITVWRVIAFAGGDPSDGEVFGFLVPTVLTALVLALIASGFYMLQPNTAAAITLFGSYRETDRHAGLRWVWPCMGKSKLSARQNLISDRIKVNDLRGNPIEMAAQVVWRVIDAAQLYNVDDYRAFVMVHI